MNEIAREDRTRSGSSGYLSVYRLLKDREAWRAAVRGVVMSRARLGD